MTFSSVVFIFFFLPVSLFIYHMLPLKCKNTFLAIDSFLFYALGAQDMVWLLVVCIMVNYILALLIEYGKQGRSWVRRAALYAALAFDIGILFGYKYLPVILRSCGLDVGLDLDGWVLPLGISFFTFREISYILDVEFETCHAQKNVINAALYFSFFPQVTMGPISKYCFFEKQLEAESRRMDLDMIFDGVKRFITGLAWKVVLSDSAMLIVNQVFSMEIVSRTVLISWMAAAAYLLQLYFDFAGYSEMAIGIGLMFGFRCEENFMRPYGAVKIGEFWRRWHATLGNWLKDYLYTPVFRVIFGKRLTLLQCDIIALIITWIVCGLWHGAGIKFLVYGLYYCSFIVGERLYQEHKKKKMKRLKQSGSEHTAGRSIWAHIYMLGAVLFGQVMFRAGSLTETFGYWAGMFGVGVKGLCDSTTIYWIRQSVVPLAICVFCCVPYEELAARLPEKCRNIIYGNIWQALLVFFYLMVFIIAVAFVMIDTNESFIYFQF